MTRTEPCAFCGVLLTWPWGRRDGKPACAKCWCADTEPQDCYSCGQPLTMFEQYEGDLCDVCIAASEKDGPDHDV